MSTETPAAPCYSPAELNYPEHLPVSGERETILTALQEHQVVVIAGETGSGKTTQLPKMLLELGLHRQGLIGHTQPRRLAARTVAERLAEELGTEIGDTVGYQVRFTAEVGEDTSVKLMTDGILLAEIQRDPKLRRYSAIIIDEAHERSLNIDVILGYLKRILPQRPDLKVIVTSATIDPERFSEHFATEESGPAPIIEVSGRTYPVEIRYRPPEETEGDLLDAVCDAVVELADEPDGDILIFLPGEREIRDAADALGSALTRHRKLAHAEILPLFGRLSLAEQRRVFTPGGRRRIVLATNVAETSLTVPGIKYVIDTGTARISRYSTRTKVQRLPIEPISQASANQRSGRCGRTSDGICLRLYAEEDFEARPEFTDPEILRTSLASVLLQMSSMGITRTPQELLDFPFVQKPDAKAVNDAVRLLSELGALERSGRVTSTGRRIAQLPVDPRLARMMVEAAGRDCLREVTVLVAGLSIQDVRERPAEQRDAADKLHARFADDKSDFSALLNLWRYLTQQQAELPSSQFRKLCRREHLNWLRIREWQDLVNQLGELAEASLRPSLNRLGRDRERPLHSAQSSAARRDKQSRRWWRGPVDPVGKHDEVHRSLLSGLLSHLGLYTPRTREYQGARGTRFAIFPGSGLFKKNPDVVMAAELVETSRLWARTVAAVDPAWAEELGSHLVKRSHSDPVWSSKRGAVVATERVTLFGVPIVADRRVLYAAIDPGFARDEFIRHALIEGDWSTRHHFDKRNRARFAEIAELEERTRRKDLRAADHYLVQFFDERLPANITSQRAFDAWWKKQRHQTPELLDLPESTLMAPEAEQVDLEAFPEYVDHDGLQLELTYAYEAGVTVRVPVLFLNQLQPHRFEWFIPGRRTEMITALIRSMPKQLRRNFVPAPDVAAAAREQLETDYDAGISPFRPALATVLRHLKGVVVDPEDLNLEALPDHLRFTFAVVSDRGRVLDSSFDLSELQVRFSKENREAISRSVDATSGPAPQLLGRSCRENAGAQHKDHSGSAQTTSAGVDVSARNQTSWTFGTIDREITSSAAGRQVTGYPALTADENGVKLTITGSAQEQALTHRRGVVVLLQHVLPSPQRYVLEHLSNRERLAFGQFAKNGTTSVETIVAEATAVALDHLVPDRLPFTVAEFEQISRHARAELIETVLNLTDVLAQVLTLNTEVRARLDSVRSKTLQPAVSDMSAQIDQLVHPGFIVTTGYSQGQHLPRYLQAMKIRLDKLEAGQNLPKDTTDMQQVQQLEDEFDDAVESHPQQLEVPAGLAAVKWMIEELRVNLFAQQLGTVQTVSAKRIRRAIKQASA